MSGFWDQGLYDPSRDHGFWSPTTASANFCEEDYAVSFYVAEFINTLSNLAYVYYAYNPPKISLPWRNVAPPGSESHSLNTEPSMVWDVHTFTLLAIGATSAIFHLTLQRIPQFLDETSMYLLIAGFAFELLTTVYQTSTVMTEAAQPAVKPSIPFWQTLLVIMVVQCLFNVSLLSFFPLYRQQPTKWETAFVWVLNGCTLKAGNDLAQMLLTRYQLRGSRDKSKGLIEPYTSIEHHNRLLIAAMIVLTLLSTTTFTLYSGDLTIHSITFAIFVLICGFKAGSMIRQHEPKTRSRLYRHLFSAYMTLNLAFALWLIDCSPSWCNFLRDSRKQLIDLLPSGLGVVLGFLTELHGWWHILTARAAAEFISLIRHITRNLPAAEGDTDRKV